MKRKKWIYPVTIGFVLKFAYGCKKGDGFNALLGGFRNEDYDAQIYGFAHFWTSTENSDGTIWYRFINVQYEEVMRYSDAKNWGQSVRCIKD